MENYKVQWTENKIAKTGNPFKKLSIEAPDGKKYDVNIFSDFPDFANIAPGSSITGKVEQKGQYWNFVSATQAPRRNGAYKDAQIERVMDKKEASIEKFQSSKEEIIKLAGAQRDAVLIVTTLINDNSMTRNTEAEVKEAIINWRNWFLNDKDFNNPPPF